MFSCFQGLLFVNVSHGSLGVLQERLLPGEILQPPFHNYWDHLCYVCTWFIHHSFVLLTVCICHGFVGISWLSKYWLRFHIRLWQAFFCNFLSLNSAAKLLLYPQSFTMLDVKSTAPCTWLTVSEFWLDKWSSVQISLNVILSIFTMADKTYCSLQGNNSYAFGSSFPAWMESQYNTFKCTPKGWERFGKLNVGLLFVSTKQSPKSHLT